ncbi:MAG: DUF2339 domain-containing protein [Actinobacteria bacterium]|nr:DUF2339 domain-containing protein [Actinomycetota bacterium]
MSQRKTNGADDISVYGTSIEDNVVGTWFARVGVLALLIGAAFGYRYAVDQGLIDPAARVTLGAVSGFALIGWGHIARRREWINFAHALSAGGVAMLYLSVLAAQFTFDLISPAQALTLLSGVALLSAWLAIGYDSLPLAIMATLGGFMNPYFMATDDPIAAMTYVVGVDLGVVCLAFYKRWASLNKLALAGTVVITVIVAPQASVVEGLGFTSVLWILFTVIPFVQATREDRNVGPIDAGLEAAVAFLYLGAGLYFLDPSGPVERGIFALVAGGIYALFAVLAYSDDRTRVPLTVIMAALSVGFITLAAPLIADGPVVHLIWAVEGAVLLYIGGVMDDVLARSAAAALIVVGLIGTVDTMAAYVPDRLLVTPTSVAIGAQVAVLYLTAWLVSRSGDDEWQRPITQAVLVTASVLTLGWLTQEARFEVIRRVHVAEIYATTQFVLSAVWLSYSTALLVAGVAFKQRWARYLGLAIFGFTLMKMVTVDLWQLEILQRTIAFVGLGVLMIGCSFMYNRFRELIVGTDG